MTPMRRLLLIFLVVIAAGAATGASASDQPSAPGNHTPGLPSDVTCTAQAAGATTCFYPAHDR